MGEVDLQRIEAELQLALPSWYRDVSRAYPFQTTRAPWMYDSPDDVIATSNDPLADADFDTARWQAGYVAIGESAAGDVYLIDARGPDSRVLCVSHEDHGITQEWPTFQAFVDEWLEYERTAGSWRIEQDEFQRKFWQRWRRVILVIVVFAVILPILVICLAQWMKPYYAVRQSL